MDAISNFNISKEKFSCRVCGSTSSASIYKVYEMVNFSGETFDYSLCKNCSSLSIVDVPPNLSEYYENYYSFGKVKENENWYDFLNKTLKRSLVKQGVFSLLSHGLFNKENDFKLKSLSPLKPKKSLKILDVGSGSGDFVYELRRIGFYNAIGIDPFLEKSISYSNGAKVLKKELSDIDSQFDIICLHHTFEHFLNPVKCLENVKKNLNESGVCVLRIPDICSYSFRLFKQHWIGIHAPYHIFLPSRDGLQTMAEKSGLEIYKSQGEQIIEFFLMSKENFLGIPDQNKSSIRALIRSGKTFRDSPWHSKSEIKLWKAQKKKVLRWDACDCITYYIRHKKG